MTNADKRKIFYSYLDTFVAAAPAANAITAKDFYVWDSTAANMCCGENWVSVN